MNHYIDGLRIDWDRVDRNSYIRDIKALRGIDELIFDKPITFFVGENGSGKSTLLEAIAESYGFNKEGGSRNYNFHTYDEASELSSAITLYKGFRKPEYNFFFRAETFFNVATMEEEYAKGNVIPEYYHRESHGEGFLHLFNILSSRKGIYLMDEPEAALSPSRQLSLFSLIHEASKNGSQFIIVSHSPILLGMPDADILSFDGDSISKIRYEDTSSYRITKSFIDHKDIMVDELTKD